MGEFAFAWNPDRQAYDYRQSGPASGAPRTGQPLTMWRPANQGDIGTIIRSNLDFFTGGVGTSLPPTRPPQLPNEGYPDPGSNPVLPYTGAGTTTYNPGYMPYTPTFNPGGPLSNPLSPVGGGSSIPPLGSGGPGDVWGTLGSAACGFVADPVKRALCMAAAGAVTTMFQGSNSGGGTCPDGYTKNAQGQCMQTGVGGTIARTLPGGNTGYAWSPTSGMYGIGAIPVAVQTTTRRCPAGWALGNDGVCYKSLERRFRAHAPARKPLLTANDGRILTRARTLEKKLKKVAGKHVHKACNCAKRAPARKR